MSKKKTDEFISQVSLIFKSYDHNVVMSKSKSNLWHFTSSYNEKNFNIYCTINISKVKSLIKIALKKTAEGTTLVVISNTCTKKDLEHSELLGYKLIPFDKLSKYGTQIIEAKAREAMDKAAS